MRPIAPWLLTALESSGRFSIRSTAASRLGLTLSRAPPGSGPRQRARPPRSSGCASECARERPVGRRAVTANSSAVLSTRTTGFAAADGLAADLGALAACAGALVATVRGTAEGSQRAPGARARTPSNTADHCASLWRPAKGCNTWSPSQDAAGSPSEGTRSSVPSLAAQKNATSVRAHCAVQFLEAEAGRGVAIPNVASAAACGDRASEPVVTETKECDEAADILHARSLPTPRDSSVSPL